MARWLYFLIPFGVGAIVLRAVGAPHELVFIFAALGIVPLAGLIGVSTEDLAHKVGPKWGGLLNATMGNAGELIIAFVALKEGLIELVKASITGSIVGNLLLVLGTGVLVGGFRYGRLTFDPREAGRHSTMMILAVAALIMPAFFHLTALSTTTPLAERNENLGIAILLLVVYGAYLTFSLRPEGAIVVHEELPEPELTGRTPWPPRIALGVLVLATGGTAVLAEALVGTVEALSHTVGLSQLFVGLIVVPLVGNVAEHFSAIQLATKGKMDISLAIAAGSSTQIALFVAAVLVISGALIGEPMNFVFQPVEIVAVGMSAILFALLAQDGETNWFEGIQLLALYGMVAVVAFFLPSATVPH
jgi:Ca2+:H+ antiporter